MAGSCEHSSNEPSGCIKYRGFLAQELLASDKGLLMELVSEVVRWSKQWSEFELCHARTILLGKWDHHMT